MKPESRSGGSAQGAVLVALVTLLAVALPATAPLYAAIYPGPGAKTIDDALTEAALETSFTPQNLTQFEKARFTATVIYDASRNPSLPTVKIAWSNEARLAAQDADAFVIEPTARSRQFLDEGNRRPGGGYELTWTWDVTPMVTGEQTIVLSILPTVVVEGRVVPDLGNINEPIRVKVDVNPAKRDFDEVVRAAAEMETELPAKMTVGEEYDVSATMSMAGHAETITADITLAQAGTSADVTISEASAAPQTARQVALAEPVLADSVVRRWTVVPDEAGQVDLVFTAIVAGRAAQQDLKQDVPKAASARAVEPGGSWWDILQKPIVYITPFVALALMLLALRKEWSKRQTAPTSATEGSSGESTQDAAPPGDPAQ